MNHPPGYIEFIMPMVKVILLTAHYTMYNIKEIIIYIEVFIVSSLSSNVAFSMVEAASFA